MNPADSSFSLLILDRDPHTRVLVEPLVASMHGRLWAAGDGDHGLALLDQEAIDVVLLALPRLKGDGLQLLEQIVRRNPSTAVIVLIDTVSVETAVEIMKKGACDLLTQPIDRERLTAALTQAHDKARRLKKAPVVLPDLDHERFAAIANSLPYGLLVCDADGRAVFFNSAFARLLGVTEPLPRGLPLAHYIHDERLDRMVTALIQESAGDRAESLTLELCVDAGRVISVRARPLAGNAAGAIVTLMDVTELKALDRLKSDFVSKVSHELRSPLSTIHEQLDLVLSDAAEGLPHSDQHLLSRAREKTRGLIDLIGDLLDLSRIEAGAVCDAPKVVDAIDMLEKVIDFLHTRAAGKHQRLELARDNHPAPVQADPLALESIFGNLITNAINYTPDGGKIRVSVARDGPWVRVRVVDNGLGIEERHLEKIFERFYRIRSDQTRHITGTGLGLPIVKGLVESLGGQIGVVSTPGRGSTFSVALPLAG